MSAILLVRYPHIPAPNPCGPPEGAHCMLLAWMEGSSKSITSGSRTDTRLFSSRKILVHPLIIPSSLESFRVGGVISGFFLYLVLDVGSISFPHSPELSWASLLPGDETRRKKGWGNLFTSAVLGIVSDHLGSQRPVGERQSQLPP